MGSSCCGGRVGVGPWGDAVRCLGTKAVKGTGLPPCAICRHGGTRGREVSRRDEGKGGLWRGWLWIREGRGKGFGLTTSRLRLSRNCTYSGECTLTICRQTGQEKEVEGEMAWLREGGCLDPVDLRGTWIIQ